LPAFFVLDRYCKEKPEDASTLHLFGLVCERVGHYELAVQLVERTIAILEAAYEESEDPAIERQFSISNTNLARLRLATGAYEGALESFESALGLLGDDDTQASDILRTQCYFGSGLAHFKLGALEDAMISFETALESAQENSVIKGHVTVLLAQTLWAIHTDEARESAKSHLLQWFVHLCLVDRFFLKICFQHCF
jgi:superkiller protein 3